VLELDEMRGWH